VKTPAKAPAKAAPKTSATAKPATPKTTKPATPRKRTTTAKPADATAAAEQVTQASEAVASPSPSSPPPPPPAAEAPPVEAPAPRSQNSVRSAAARKAQAARLAEVIKRAEATRQVAQATIVVEDAVVVDVAVEAAPAVEDVPVVVVELPSAEEASVEDEPAVAVEVPDADEVLVPEETFVEVVEVVEVVSVADVEVAAAEAEIEAEAEAEIEIEAVTDDAVLEEAPLETEAAVVVTVAEVDDVVVVVDDDTVVESVVAETDPATRPAAPSAVAVIEASADDAEPREVVLSIAGLVKRFDDTIAVAGIDLEIAAGSFFGIVGPNGAGKTTTLSMVTGLLKPDAGSVTVHGADVWNNPVAAKRTMGVLPDRLRLFDRLTGAQLLYYSGILHGLEKSVVRSRTSDLAAAFGLEDSLDRLVSDYSAGMTKKIAIAAAMIHSPRLLVFDEPFEAVDPVSAANIIEILQKYVAAGGTVVISSHTMNLIERICDSVAVVVNGAVLATGTMSEVRNGKTLEERFVELAGGRRAAEGMEWLHKFSD
jgi:ABC-type multidrug transport system ATPase subunit